jgi:NAD(P)-dependent dehydrogenase (short-subunit alcohol dehydrogenase family)
VRDYDKPKFALDQGIAELGRLDIVVANAGLWSYGLVQELTEAAIREEVKHPSAESVIREPVHTTARPDSAG